MERWVASKEAVNVFDLLKACADALFALEQSSKRDKDRALSEGEIKKKIEGGRKLLDKVALALESKTEHRLESDPFILKLVSEIRSESNLTYRRLLECTLKAKSQLRRRKVSPETVEILERIYKNLMSLSTKRIEALSRPLT
jgi:DNA recombination-dependent growth factor C